MLRVGLVPLICLFFCSCKKLATPLEFAESQFGVEEGSPSIRQYLLAVPQEIRAARFCSSVAIKALNTSVDVIPIDESVVPPYQRQSDLHEGET
jgi:hypothetical protein